MADKWSKYEVAQPEEPGWFQPGSKLEAAVRGFSQAATFGFGDEIQAFLRAIGGEGNYLDRVKQLKQEERDANIAAQQTNPNSYLAGNLVGSLPQAANVVSVARSAPTLAGQALRGGAAGATYGAVQGAGQADTMGQIPETALKSAALSGMINAAVPVAGAGLSKLGEKAAPIASKAAEKLPENTVRLSNGDLFNTALKRYVNRQGQATGPKIVEVGEDGLPIVVKAKSQGSAMAAGAAPTLGTSGGAVFGALQDVASQDPVEAGVERAKNAVQGAALGWGAAKGATMAGRALDVAKTAGQASARAVGSGLQSPGGELAARTATSTTVQQPFAKINEYLGATNDERRKNAMEQQNSPQGRAQTNGESPLKDRWSDYED